MMFATNFQTISDIQVGRRYLCSGLQGLDHWAAVP